MQIVGFLQWSACFEKPLKNSPGESLMTVSTVNLWKDRHILFVISFCCMSTINGRCRFGTQHFSQTGLISVVNLYSVLTSYWQLLILLKYMCKFVTHFVLNNFRNKLVCQVVFPGVLPFSPHLLIGSSRYEWNNLERDVKLKNKKNNKKTKQKKNNKKKTKTDTLCLHQTNFRTPWK